MLIGFLSTLAVTTAILFFTNDPLLAGLAVLICGLFYIGDMATSWPRSKG